VHDFVQRGAGWSNVNDDSSSSGESALAFLKSIAAYARERVVTFEGFKQGFLFGLIGNKDVVAEFSGVPPERTSHGMDAGGLFHYCSDVPGRNHCLPCSYVNYAVRIYNLQRLCIETVFASSCSKKHTIRLTRTIQLQRISVELIKKYKHY